ncbi:MAG: hypothetical protein WC975_04900 [Phycisphaerae bacterium]
MSDPKKNDSNSDQVSAVNVDTLLAEVQEMTERVENLIGTNEGEGPKAANETQPNDEKKEPSDSSPMETLDRALESGKHVPVDQQTDKLADDEINQVLNRIVQKKQSKTAGEENSGQEGTVGLPLEELPESAKMILNGLLTFDRPFLWVPKSVKDILGYAGIATLLFALILWTFLGISGK